LIAHQTECFFLLASVEFTSNGKTYKVLKEQSFTEILDIIIIAWRDGACQRSQQFFLTRLISSSNREDVFFGYYAIKVLSWQVYVQSCLFRSTAAAGCSFVEEDRLRHLFVLSRAVCSTSL